MRSLTAEEEAEFQCVVSNHSTESPEPTPLVPADAAVGDSGYAVMTRIRVDDRWAWTTWMRFETYAEAEAHALESDEVVRFRSPEWAALSQHSEPVSPFVMDVPRESIPPRGEGETFVDFVLQLLAAYGLSQHTKPISDEKDSLINTDMIDLVLSRLSEAETRELERMYAEDKHAFVEALGNRFRTVRKPKSGCH